MRLNQGSFDVLLPTEDDQKKYKYFWSSYAHNKNGEQLRITAWYITEIA